jgi:hypothetical protein
MVMDREDDVCCAGKPEWQRQGSNRTVRQHAQLAFALAAKSATAMFCNLSLLATLRLSIASALGQKQESTNVWALERRHQKAKLAHRSDSQAAMYICKVWLPLVTSWNK